MQEKTNIPNIPQFIEQTHFNEYTKTSLEMAKYPNNKLTATS